MALIHEPEVLFLDEPTTGLDPTSRLNLWDEVRNLNADGTTVFLTTQYLEEADELAARIAIIDHGRLVREGRPSDLKAAVGAPTLKVEVRPDQESIAREVLVRFGPERVARRGVIAIGLEGGAGEMTAVVRAFDESSVVVTHLELDAPTLDDVFAEATGYRLEGAGADEPDVKEPVA
jgi:ABC-2 type transport system ATP-binding protein